jgi:REP element-mobilizing transposase RayT
VKHGIPNLRGSALRKTIGGGFRKAAASPWTRQVRRRESFRVVHFSIQPNHLHLIIEAENREVLSRGMQGLAAGLARRINRALGRRGAVFAERYHAHELRGPEEVRRSIVYVLKNYAKHRVTRDDRDTEPVKGIDPCSSARWFDGWAEACPRPPSAAPVADARTWLLRVGWNLRGGGKIGRNEVPAGCEEP